MHFWLNFYSTLHSWYIAYPMFIYHFKIYITEMSHLTILKIAAFRYLGFLKVWFFEQLVSFAGLICAIMQNFVKIGQTVSGISDFSIFKMAAVCHLGFWNFSLNFWFPIRLRGLRCIIIPNFIRDIAFNVFSKWRPSAILDF